MSERSVTMEQPDYGIDAPAVLRNLFIFGALAVLLGLFGPAHVRIGPVDVLPRSMLLVTGSILLLEAVLYLYYVRVGKLKHRDLMLSLHSWRGDEQVLDVGCGRGLLLVGAARRLAPGSGHATGLDIWSNEDMGSNSETATRRNLQLESVGERCTLVSAPAQEMPFADDSFDLIVSNLCLHNIYDRPTRERAIQQIVRVLKPGGVALLSDYKHTGQYAQQLRSAGLSARRRWGNFLNFPPLRIVIARRN